MSERPEVRWLYPRLLTFYAAAVGSIAAIPYLAVVLADAGVSGTWIAALLLSLPLGQLFGAPFWAWLADHTGAHQLVFRAASTLLGLSGALLIVADTPGWIACAVVGIAVSRAPIGPIADATTVGLLGENGRNYGRIRAFGSLAFLVSVSASGFLRQFWPSSPLWIGGGLLVVTGVVSWALPAPARPPRGATPGDLREILVHPLLAPLLVICVLHGMTISAYDSLFSLHVEQLGFSSAATGAAFALGVAVEIAVMVGGRSLIDRVGPLPLMVFGIAAGIPRWWITGTTHSQTVLIATQALHGVQFGAFWIGGVALFSERSPPNLRTAVQSLLTASTFGVGHLASMGLATVVLQTHPVGALFHAMTAASVLATVLGVWLWRRTR